jgi:hypothetical protein
MGINTGMFALAAAKKESSKLKVLLSNSGKSYYRKQDEE